MSVVLWVTSHLLESHAYLSLSYLWKCRLGLSEKEKERPLTTSQRLREIERRERREIQREREEKSVVNLSFSFRISLFFISFFHWVHLLGFCIKDNRSMRKRETNADKTIPWYVKDTVWERIVWEREKEIEILQHFGPREKRNQEVKEREKRFSITRMVCAWRLHPNTRNQATARKRREKNPNKEMNEKSTANRWNIKINELIMVGLWLSLNVLSFKLV